MLWRNKYGWIIVYKNIHFSCRSIIVLFGSYDDHIYSVGWEILAFECCCSA